MPDNGKKLRPVREARETEYPSYRRYRDERRKVLLWLGAGGATVAAGGLVGCDTVLGALGLARPPAQLQGEIACPTTPTPVQAGGDDDDSARPEIRHTKGEPVAPEPPTPEEVRGTGVGEMAKPETHHLAGGPRASSSEVGTIGAQGEPITAEGVRPEVHLKGDVAVPDPPVDPDSVPVKPEGQLRGRIKRPEDT